MAESAKKVKKKGGRYCVAGAPNNQSCKNNSYTPGVTMHQFPLDVNTREKWVKFVQRHRRDFRPTSKYTSLCSAHFEDDCYNRTVQIAGLKMSRVLKKDAVPTRDTVIPTQEKTLSVRSKRKVYTVVYNFENNHDSCYSYTCRIL